jgi:hypothetical protein
MIIPISASQVARITGVSVWCLACVCTSFYVDIFFHFSLGRYLQVKLLGHMVTWVIYVIFSVTVWLFYQGCIILHSHRQCMRGSNCSIPHQHFLLSVCWVIRCELASHEVRFIFLQTWWYWTSFRVLIDHLFPKCLFRSFAIGLGVLLCWPAIISGICYIVIENRILTIL